MFTGIIRELGVVRRMGYSGGLYDLEISSGDISVSAGVGDSVAVNGVCLTVTRKAGHILRFDVMAETARRTTISALRAGEEVNLESSLKAGSGLDGHFVLGHIDCVGDVISVYDSGGESAMRVGFPPEFSGLLVDKGSVAIDGVSLTVGEAGDTDFTVYLIPETLRSTTLGRRKASGRVNIEFDILGKYIKKISASRRAGMTESFLKENGF